MTRMPPRTFSLQAFAMVALLLQPALQPLSSGATPRTGVLEVRDVRLQYVDWGGSGESLVLVPARCETPFVFADFAPLLVNRFRVLGVMARGCGVAGPASDGYSLDLQIRDLVGFLDALKIDRATFAGHSASGGKVVRLARQFPSRVARIVTFDIIYADVPEQFESKFQAAIAAQNPTAPHLSLESHRREFQAWELGTWSAALERDFEEQTEKSANGVLRYRDLPEGWQRAFIEDVRQGRYYETAITHPALFFVARDLDLERLKQFPPEVQNGLRPMAEAIRRARADQIARYQRNGAHVRVEWLEHASHYLFVDKARDVAARLSSFVDEAHK
jgi:pimeloyl-ACP methyl ester carboxylesterase